jgi:hypothetical protein
MKRLVCLSVLLLPLTGCAFFEDCVAFSETEWHKFADDPAPGPVRACGDGPLLIQQTAEPPR